MLRASLILLLLVNGALAWRVTKDYQYLGRWRSVMQFALREPRAINTIDGVGVDGRSVFGPQATVWVLFRLREVGGEDAVQYWREVAQGAPPGARFVAYCDAPGCFGGNVPRTVSVSLYCSTRLGAAMEELDRRRQVLVVDHLQRLVATPLRGSRDQLLGDIKDALRRAEQTS